MIKTCIYILFFTLCYCNLSFSLEISAADITIIRIAVVDMDKILDSVPQVKSIEEEYFKLKQSKEKEISELQQEIEELIKKRILIQTEISMLETQIQQINKKIFSSTSTVEGETADLEQEVKEKVKQLESDIEVKRKNLHELEKEVEEKKNLIEEKKRGIEVELKKFKDKKEAEIYGFLYTIIEKIAEEEKINIVIEKSSILYGVPEIDITDKVIKYLTK